jgi:hypothetical protein
VDSERMSQLEEDVGGLKLSVAGLEEDLANLKRSVADFNNADLTLLDRLLGVRNVSRPCGPCGIARVGYTGRVDTRIYIQLFRAQIIVCM